MAYETILTILFAIGAGAAIIAYAARPRHGAPSITVAHTSTMESYSQAEPYEQAAMPQVTAVQAPVVEEPAPAEVHQIADVTPVVVAEVAAAGPSEAPSIPTATADVSAAGPLAASGASEQPVTRSAKTQRRRSTATRAHAKSGHRTSRKHSQTGA